MIGAVAVRSDSIIKKITLTAVFTALCCIGTVSIAIPLPTGYVNVGDVFVLLSAWLLGPLYGTVAAGFGSCIADVLAGFPIYAPATLIVKAGVALIGYYFSVLIKKLIKKAPNFTCRILAVILAEGFMVLGYFVFESALYGVATASLTLLGNTIQGLICGTVAVLISCALAPIKYVNNTFPHFSLNWQKRDKKTN
jgi:uncharacterized membrane protein